jgi:uncharacterized protein YecE (DUF72 family)
MSQLYAGTSGFAYASWKPDFYPANAKQKDFLSYYAQRLNSVEINYTFRQLPSATTLENWVNATKPGFVFSLKAPMRITHVLRLKDAGQFTDVFLRAIDPLRAVRRLGPILFQLPPHFPCNVALLTEFLGRLPQDIRFAFEFRHASWLAAPVYEALQRHGVALCLAESEKLEVPEVITAGFLYYRLRKPEYTPEDRKQISGRVKEFLQAGKDVFVFFKHEDTPEGALYAEELLKTAS